jgi:hypothetical protein
MRASAWFFATLLCAPLRASAQVVRADEAWASSAVDGVRAVLAARPKTIVQKPAAAPDMEVLRAALIARLKRNPVAAEYAVPILEEKDGVTFAISSETDDAGLKGAWATYKRTSRTMVLNRDAIDSDLGASAAGRMDQIADRYMPVIVHELGGHARHYEQLAKILGAPAPNARETETNALRLEAMATAAERKINPNYLRDDKEYARTESTLVDKYWESKEKRDPGIFADFVAAVPNYGKIPPASGASAEYFRNEERGLVSADQRLVGDDPPADEIGVGRREPLDGGRSMRR